jgi:peptide/nickel transport system substrate-binding protein
LLERAGFNRVGADGIRSNARGDKLSFRASIIEGSYKDAALLIQRYLKDIGIEMVITFVDSGRQSDIIYEQDFDTDMYIWGWTGDYEDPSFILSIMRTEEVGESSDCFYSNPEYDKLYLEQLSILDRNRRVEVVHQMQKILYEDLPYIMLYSNVSMMALRNNCTNYVQYPAGFGSITNIRSYTNIKKN